MKKHTSNVDVSHAGIEKFFDCPLAPFTRPANIEDYYQVRGILYRKGPKTSKRARKNAAILAARQEVRNAA